VTFVWLKCFRRQEKSDDGFRVKEGVIIRDHDKNNERGGLPETSKVWVSNWFLYGSSINC